MAVSAENSERGAMASRERARFRGKLERNSRLMFGPRPRRRRYTSVFSLSPPGIFGVQQEGVQLLTVLAEQQYSSDVRPLPRLSLRVGRRNARLAGNLLEVDQVSKDVSDAAEAAERAAERFTRYLTTKVGVHISVRYESSYSAVGPASAKSSVHTSRQVFYNPGFIKRVAREAAELASAEDVTLDSALNLYEHAMVLLEAANLSNPGFPKRFEQLEADYQRWMADIVMNLWKTQAQLLGEGHKRKLKRSRILQLDSNLLSGLASLEDLRNKAGVAHTRAVHPGAKDLRLGFDAARNSVQSLLVRYSDYVRSHGSLPL